MVDWILEKYGTCKIVKFSLCNVILGTLHKDIRLYMMFIWAKNLLFKKYIFITSRKIACIIILFNNVFFCMHVYPVLLCECEYMSVYESSIMFIEI